MSTSTSLSAILDDGLLKEIANNLETDEQMESLALALRIPRAEVNRAHATNRATGSVSTRGTFDLLSKWRATVSPDLQMTSMNSAMTSARLVYLRDTVLRKGEQRAHQNSYYQSHHQHQQQHHQSHSSVPYTPHGHQPHMADQPAFVPNILPSRQPVYQSAATFSTTSCNVSMEPPLQFSSSRFARSISQESHPVPESENRPSLDFSSTGSSPDFHPLTSTNQAEQVPYASDGQRDYSLGDCKSSILLTSANTAQQVAYVSSGQEDYSLGDCKSSTKLAELVPRVSPNMLDYPDSKCECSIPLGSANKAEPVSSVSQELNFPGHECKSLLPLGSTNPGEIIHADSSQSSSYLQTNECTCSIPLASKDTEKMLSIVSHGQRESTPGETISKVQIPMKEAEIISQVSANKRDYKANESVSSIPLGSANTVDEASVASQRASNTSLSKPTKSKDPVPLKQTGVVFQTPTAMEACERTTPNCTKSTDPQELYSSVMQRSNDGQACECTCSMRPTTKGDVVCLMPTAMKDLPEGSVRQSHTAQVSASSQTTEGISTSAALSSIDASELVSHVSQGLSYSQASQSSINVQLTSTNQRELVSDGSPRVSVLSESLIDPAELMSMVPQGLKDLPPNAHITFMMGHFHISVPDSSRTEESASSVARQPTVVPHALRHELSVKLNRESVTLGNWVGLAIKLDLDDYIESLRLPIVKDPTEELIKIAEYEKKVTSLEDLVRVFTRMKCFDCVDIVERFLRKGNEKEALSDQEANCSEGDS